MLLEGGQHSEIALIQYRTAEPLDVASASALLLFGSTVLPMAARERKTVRRSVHSSSGKPICAGVGAVTARGGRRYRTGMSINRLIRPSSKYSRARRSRLKKVMDEYKGMPALDAGLLAAAQAVEHYEISRYGTLKTWANELGYADAVKLLDATLKEEKATDSALSQLAESEVNQHAETAKAA